VVEFKFDCDSDIMGLMKHGKDLLYPGLLLMLALAFWWGALLPGKVLFFRDLSVEIVAKRHFFENSCGISLWCPYIFFGTPFAANAQSQAFYPMNFLFCVFGAERGLVYYIVFHHILFTLTFYLALRRISFSAEASLIGAAGAGFGPYMTGLTLYVVLLSAAAWMPLIMVCLNEALKKNRLRWGLLLGLLLALQFLAGEYEISAMTAVFAAAAVFSSRPGKWSDLARLAGVLVFGAAWGIALSLPQLALTWEMTPLSNRSAGMDLQSALWWSMELPMLKNLVIPNYFLPYSAGIYSYLGKFTLRNFFESFYLGAGLIPLMFFAFFSRDRLRVWFWFLIALLGLSMMLGDALPVYGFFYNHLPGMNFFRIPSKFFFFVNFSFIMLVLYGFEFIESRKWSSALVAAALVITGLTAAGLIIANPVWVSELGDKFVEISRYFYVRCMMRASACFLVSMGLVFLAGILKRNALGIFFAAVVFADLFLAHHYLNPPADRDFYKPNQMIREIKDKEKDRIAPLRIFSAFNSNELVPKTVASRYWRYEKARDYLEYDWAVYFDLDNLRGESSFYPSDIDRFKSVLARTGWPAAELVLARSGVEYTYHPDTGFKKLPGVFSRAMVFYQASEVSGLEEAMRLLSALDFPARQTLLLENAAPAPGPAQDLIMAEPAKVVQYENEKVAVEADAKRGGWLLLLDAYYPGWSAELDGKVVPVVRANGFFRAVKVPAGKHRVVFKYHPEIFYRSVLVSGVGLIIWLGLFAISFKKSRSRP